MKKWLLMLLSILLIAAMALSFAACGDKEKDEDDDDKKGSSAKKYDEDSVVGKWEGTIDYTEMLGLGFDVFADVSWEFFEDGTYAATIYLASITDSMEENGGEILEELASSAGMSVSDFLEYMEISMGGSDTQAEGSYEFEDGELILDGTVLDCEFTGDELSFDMEGLPVELQR